MNSLINTIGGLIKLSLGVISVPIMVKVLGLELYGKYVIVTAFVNFFAMSEWSISLAVTVFLAREITEGKYHSVKYKNILSSIFIVIILFSFVTCLLLYTFSPLLAELINNSSSTSKDFLSDSILLICFILFFRCLIQFFVGIEQAYKNYKITNLISTFYNILLTLGTLLVAWFYQSIIYLLILQLLINILFVFVHFAWCYKEKFFYINYFSFNNKYTVPILKFCTKTWSGSLGGMLFLQGDKLLVSHMFGVNFTGIYSAITSITTQINQISSLPIQVIVPTISNLLANKDNKPNEYIIKTLRNVFNINVFVSITLGVFINFFALEIINLFLNDHVDKIGNNVYYLIIASTIYSIYSLNATGYFILYAIGKEGYVAIITILSSIISLLFILFFSKSIGPIGAFLGNAGFIITLLFIHKSISLINMSSLELLKIIIIPIVILFLSIFVSMSNFNLLLRAVIFIGSFLLIFINFIIISKEYIISFVNNKFGYFK